MNQIKLKRIGSQIQKDLMDICNTEAHDSLLQHITITGVEVTNDLGLARVYFTTTDDRVKVEKDLNNASGFFRSLLAERLQIRHTPELKFIFDESIEYGQKIEKIIEELHKED